MVSVISWVLAGPTACPCCWAWAWARAWVRLELLMVRVISCPPPPTPPINPDAPITWLRSWEPAVGGGGRVLC